MKPYIHKYLIGAVVALAATACGDDFVNPPMILPAAPDMQANTTVAQLKERYWSTDKNYVATVGDADADGNHVIIRGRVLSSDATGNIYKSVIIGDETGALTFAVNAYDLYKSYMFGQEVFVDMTGMKIGGYNGLMQAGGEGTYNGAPSMTFMGEDVMKSHAFPSGLPQVELVDTVLTDLATLETAKTTPAGLQQWQSQLVRVDGVSFEDAGQPFAGSANANRYVVGEGGKKLLVRNSSYASFHNDLLPYGTGSVVGILSYYGSDWQMLLIDEKGCIGFDNTVPEQPTPPAPQEPTQTIAQVRETYFRYGVTEDNNYVATVAALSDGRDCIIKARVISSDASGNIFKTMYVEDATGGLAIAVNDSKIYNTFPLGQEVVINLTGMNIGNYAGMLQVGANNSGQMGRMELSALTAATALVGTPETPSPMVITIPQLSTATPADVSKYQSRLVKIEGLTFQETGVLNNTGNNVNLTLKDAAGNTIITRVSNYASFKDSPIPTGTVSVTAVMGFYLGTWQLLLNDYSDIK